MRVCFERGMEIDICDSCNGVWLDAGELTKLAEDEKRRRYTWTILANQECPLTTLNCSRCSETILVEVVIEDHAFQVCRGCGGLFIDSGTLDSITLREDDEYRGTMRESIAIEGVIQSLSALLYW